MTFPDIYRVVQPYILISEKKAAELYDFVMSEKPRDIFEMGFYRGGSTLVMAAALEELGVGHIDTFDLVGAQRSEPSIADLAAETGLGRFISAHYCDWCCEWELAKILAAARGPLGYEPRFDFAFIDGGHKWTDTGYAFFLVSILLRPGAWILFDDLNWTMNRSPSPRVAERKLSFPEDVRQSAMVGMVFDLLVRESKDFCDFRTSANGDWGWARKVG